MIALIHPDKQKKMADKKWSNNNIYMYCYTLSIQLTLLILKLQALLHVSSFLSLQIQ